MGSEIDIYQWQRSTTGYGLTKRMEEEIDGKGWYRMGKLMIKVGQFDRAEVRFNELLKKATNESIKSER